MAEDSMALIELIQKVWKKEIGLPTFSGFCLYDRTQRCLGTTCFLRNHCSFWSRTIHWHRCFVKRFQIDR